MLIGERTSRTYLWLNFVQDLEAQSAQYVSVASTSSIVCYPTTRRNGSYRSCYSCHRKLPCQEYDCKIFQEVLYSADNAIQLWEMSLASPVQVLGALSTKTKFVAPASSVVRCQTTRPNGHPTGCYPSYRMGPVQTTTPEISKHGCRPVERMSFGSIFGWGLATKIQHIQSVQCWFEATEEQHLSLVDNIFRDKIFWRRYWCSTLGG